MKQYSADYFNKKFHILFDKLMIKEGFVDAVKKTRKELGIPQDGFNSKLELAEYLMKRLSKKERQSITLMAFIEQYEMLHKKRIEEKDKEQFFNEFYKKIKGKDSSLAIMICYQWHLEDHNDFFTKDPVISHGKENSKLFSKGWSIFKKFFALDLLDQHIAMQFIEKYLFLGVNGVNEYIKSKISCQHCRYIGVSHFSPEGRNMVKGKDSYPFSGNYIFNEGAVKLLSSYFDSVFILIRPYAVKEQVIQYIEDNWNDLKEHMTEKNSFYKQLGVHPTKIKESDIERNQFVYDLYKLSKKDILKTYKGKQDLSGTDTYKEKIVSVILQEEYDIKMSPDAVKKTATRFAKSIKVKKEPKDIRDI
jgi:hypothetical protein